MIRKLQVVISGEDGEKERKVGRRREIKKRTRGEEERERGRGRGGGIGIQAKNWK